jgi:mRNA interferase RelE/StbE
LAWKIEYLSASRRQLKKLDPEVRARILEYMREWIDEGDSPYDSGHALTGKWKGHWRYRVDDYRLICKIQNERLVVLVVKAGHRGDVYI